ncbi:MAG TPA: ribosome maturation factor RimM [Solirubrobacteraceae bacterium]|jgi:16S rRNA processing protein RimM
MPDAPVVLPAGRVGRPHGLDGSFYVTGARARLLGVGTVVAVGGRDAPIIRRAGTDEHPIVRLQGVEDRDGAQTLRGLELTVRAPSAPTLAEGEWWAHELEGCEVFGGERRLGTVARLIELPSCEALEVQPPRGGEALLVPMVKDAIRAVEIERRRIEVDLAFLGYEDQPPARSGGEA